MKRFLSILLAVALVFIVAACSKAEPLPTAEPTPELIQTPEPTPEPTPAPTPEPEKEETPVVKTKVLSKPRVTPKPEPKVKPKAVEPKEVKRSVYDQEEFEEFTEGIRKTSTFRRILNYNSSKAYESEEAKEEIIKDPVQVPEWQEEKQSVVIRPIINYDNAPKSMPKGNFIPSNNREDNVYEEETSVIETAARKPIIINKIIFLNIEHNKLLPNLKKFLFSLFLTYFVNFY